MYRERELAADRGEEGAWWASLGPEEDRQGGETEAERYARRMREVFGETDD